MIKKVSHPVTKSIDSNHIGKMSNYYLCEIKTELDSVEYIVVRKEWIYNPRKKKDMKDKTHFVFFSKDFSKKRPRSIATNLLVKSKSETENDFIISATGFLGFGK
jgi:hypothetical protein